MFRLKIQSNLRISANGNNEKIYEKGMRKLEMANSFLCQSEEAGAVVASGRKVGVMTWKSPFDNKTNRQF